MGYSGATAPMPVVPCLPEDWWDPAWQAVKSPGTALLEPEICEAVHISGAPATGTSPAEDSGMESPEPPSWRQVLATTFELWSSRHLSWLRRSARRSSRLLAVSALGAGLVAVAVGTFGLTGALSPAPAIQVARPVPIPAPSGRTVRAASLPTTQQAARPVWLSVPKLGIRTSLIGLGLNKNGTLQVPSSTAVAGWFTGSPRPGMVGSAVIAGHVDSRAGLGIFFWLRTLRPGERVYVGRADGTMAVFTVTAVRTYPKDRFPTAAVYGSVPDAELRLITCGGVFDRSLGSYLSNVVVFARLTG